MPGCVLLLMSIPTSSFVIAHMGQSAAKIGWGWFDASRNEPLRETNCVVGNVVHHSLTSADIPETTFRQLAAEAE